MGLLQIRTETGFGTVCGLNHGAADLICRTMGYDHGTTGSNPCSSYGGANVCGELGSLVAMKALSCNSGNLGLDGLTNKCNLLILVCFHLVPSAGAHGMCQMLFAWGTSWMLWFSAGCKRPLLRHSNREHCDCWLTMGRQAQMERDGWTCSWMVIGLLFALMVFLLVLQILLASKWDIQLLHLQCTANACWLKS